MGLGAVEVTQVLHMPSRQTHQDSGAEILIMLVKIFKRYLGPGRLPVASGRPHLGEYIFRQAAGVFLVAVATEDDHETFTVNTGDKNPGYLLDMIEEIRDNY